MLVNSQPPYQMKYGRKPVKSAANRTRTCDMLVNSQPLYQLSYGGTRISALYSFS